MARWSADDLPDLSGRRYVVTGGNGGLGFETTRALVRKGAQVVVACRDAAKAQAALDAIQAEGPPGRAEFRALDLADLASVRRFAEASAADGPLHGLVNNAGVMALPRRTTRDGFEMQLGTNHLGHFALTGLLLERLLATPDSRIVSVSSSVHHVGRMHFADLQLERAYEKWKAYAQSKLANLLFAFELQRRLEAAGRAPIALAAHPGYAATELQAVGPRMQGAAGLERFMEFANRAFAQSAAMGALPSLHAVAAPGVRGGDYYGPDRLFGTRGHPAPARPSRRARDRAAAQRLWQISEELTGVRFAALA